MQQCRAAEMYAESVLVCGEDFYDVLVRCLDWIALFWRCIV